MTTTELALIKSETPEPVAPLDSKAAKALDKKVRATSDKVTKGFTTLDGTINDLGNLIKQAIDGDIHKGLGLKSWTVWVKDAVQITVPDRFQRKELVRALSSKGMSQRAIADMFTNASQKTVDRDLEGEPVEEGATVTSLDGAQRPKTKVTKAPEPQDDSGDYIDAEVVDADPKDDGPFEPMKAVDIVTAFDEEMANLWAAHSELADLTHEDKWDGARNRITKANMNNLQTVITNLQAIVDNLMGGE